MPYLAEHRTPEWTSGWTLQGGWTCQSRWTSLLAVALLCVVVPAISLQAQTPTPPATPKPAHAAGKTTPRTAKTTARHRASTGKSPSENTVPPPPPTPPTPGQQPARPAVVSFANGNLTVKADNSSLNRTLREVSRVANIKLTGSVPESRVYGTYGPGSPAAILSELLQGTDSNMLFLHGQGATSSELILTPRNGGPSLPPSPDVDETPAPTPEFQPRPLQPTAPPGIAGPPAAPHSSSMGGESPEPAPGTTNQPSPNGVKTPQQIYEELQRMRQDQPPPQ